MDTTYLVEEIDKRLPNFEQLQADIETITVKSWTNPRFERIASYNSKSESESKSVSTGGQDSCLFTLDEIRSNPDILHISDTNHGPSFEDKKPLMDIATEFNTVNFFQNKETRTNFIFLINSSMQTMTKTVQKLVSQDPSLNLGDNVIDVMFKGGTTMRILIKELVRNFTAEVENYVNEMLKDSIKLSDYDFEIVTMTTVPEHIINKINIITYICVLRIRNYLEHHSLVFFDFFKLTESIQHQKIKELTSKMQKSIDNKGPDSFFYGAKIDHVSYSGGCTDSIPGLLAYRYVTAPDEDEVSSCRADSAFISDISHQVPDVGVISAVKLLREHYGSRYSQLANPSRRRGSRFYATHNPEIGWVNNGTDMHRFALNRIKFNYTLYMSLNDLKLMIDIPGEILDLSHAHNADLKKTKFTKPLYQLDFLQRFRFMNNNLTYLSYSLKGHIQDISNILFNEVGYMPWNDAKYQKRIRRLIIIAALMYFNTSGGYKHKLSKLQLIVQYIMDPSKPAVVTNDPTLDSLVSDIVRSMETGVANGQYREAGQFQRTCIAEFEKIYKAFHAQWEFTRDQVFSYSDTGDYRSAGLLDYPLELDYPNLY